MSQEDSWALGTRSLPPSPGRCSPHTTLGGLGSPTTFHSINGLHADVSSESASTHSAGFDSMMCGSEIARLCLLLSYRPLGVLAAPAWTPVPPRWPGSPSPLSPVTGGWSLLQTWGIGPGLVPTPSR